MNTPLNNTADIDAALTNLHQVISKRIAMHISHEIIDLNSFINATFSNQFINATIAGKLPQQLSANEWIILLLALAPHIQPNLFESIIAEHLPAGGDFAEFGGVRATNHRSLLPTGETAQFILAGNNIDERLQVHQYFTDEHFFFRNSILWLEPVKEGEPQMSGRIIIAQEWVDKLLLDKESTPRFGPNFPAKKIITGMNWDDAVLYPQTNRQINDISTWLKHSHKINDDKNLGRKIKPGYRVLFYVPPGTYNLVLWFVNNIQKILRWVNAVLDSPGNLAMGAIGAAIGFIVGGIKVIIPVILDFFAKFLNISGIVAKQKVLFLK